MAFSKILFEFFFTKEQEFLPAFYTQLWRCVLHTGACYTRDLRCKHLIYEHVIIGYQSVNYDVDSVHSNVAITHYILFTHNCSSIQHLQIH